MKIGIIGPKGFIGTKVVEKISNIISITRDNYNDYIGEHFDIIINAAGNNKNFWANKYPYKDFEASTNLVYSSLFDFPTGKYVFISSVAVYDNTSHYGFNKLLSEQIIKRHSKKHLILRSCSVIDKYMNIGIVSDIYKNIPLFATNDSQMQFITRDSFVDIMIDLLNYNESISLNFGGIGHVTVQELQEIIGKKAEIKPEATLRKYEMDVSELTKIVPLLKTSKEYVMDIVNK